MKALVKFETATRDQALQQETKILTFVHQGEKALTQAALELERFVQTKCWEPLGYKGLSEWREARFGKSSWRFFEMRRAGRLLKAGVSASDVEEIPQTNLHNLTRLPEKYWKEGKWIESAMGDDVATFEAKVEAALEEKHLKVEGAVTRGFRIPKSLADRWDFALKVAETVDGCERMEERVEVLTATYLGSPSGKKGKTREQRFYELEKGE